MANLKKHGDWDYYDINMRKVKSGSGIAALKNVLPNNDTGFALIRIEAANVGNAGSEITTVANIILQWKGPSCSAMKKVKGNGALQTALSSLKPNKGYIEVLGYNNLDCDTIFDRWRPGSGSKVISD